MFNKSIIKKFMFLYIIVGISSLSLIGFYSYFKAKKALVERAYEQLNSVKSIKKNQLENYEAYCCQQKKALSQEEVNSILLDTTHTTGLGKSGEIYLVGTDYYMKSKSRFYDQNYKAIKAKTLSAQQAFRSGDGRAVARDYRNILCLSSFDTLTVASQKVVIISEIDYDEAMKPITNLRNDLIFVSVIVLILIFSIAQVIASDIILPIIKLKNSAVKIGMGDFNSKVDIKTENEFGLLASSFNRMIDDIQKNTKELLDEKTKRISSLYDGQEFERHRISRDLHDGLAQQLIAIKLSLENIIARKQFLDQVKISELKNHINLSIDELRKISNDLAPAGIMEFGIETSLENLCSQIRSNSGIATEFSSFGNFSEMNSRIKIYLYRIVQEALTNVIKHAQADQIKIQLTETHHNYVLIIEDNGKGFNYDTHNLGLGKGLLNMKERSILLNGTFDVESLSGHGTTIRVKINKTSDNE